MNEKNRKSLGGKILFGIVVIAVVIVIAISVPVSFGFYYIKLNEFTNEAFSHTRVAAEIIDGDRVLSYLETGEKDDYYNAILKFLNATQKETHLKYYYVFVPYENDLVYVWDAENVEGACELGEHEEYMEGGKEAVDEVFRQDPPENIKLTRDEKYGYIASAFSPIFNSEGEPVAVVGADLSVPNINNIIRQIIMLIIIITGVVCMIMMIITYFILKKNLIKPIRLLTESAGRMVSNIERDETEEIKINTNDELETLADSFVKMDTDLRSYISQLELITAERERIGAELNVAKNIQMDMLPSIFPFMPERAEFDLYATMAPAKEVGGDFYDFFMVDDDHLAVVIADVSGKGVPAALFMVITKTLIENSTIPGRSPSEIFSLVNDQLCEGNETAMFVTAWMAIIDLRTGIGTAVNAGHEHPARKSTDGSFELIRYKHSPALAVMEGVKFKEREFRLESGEMLYVYTDGVTEASNVDSELFGELRLETALNKYAGDEPQQLLPDIRSEIEDFTGDAPQFDDITMLALKYCGH